MRGYIATSSVILPRTFSRYCFSLRASFKLPTSGARFRWCTMFEFSVSSVATRIRDVFGSTSEPVCHLFYDPAIMSFYGNTFHQMKLGIVSCVYEVFDV